MEQKDLVDGWYMLFLQSYSFFSWISFKNWEIYGNIAEQWSSLDTAKESIGSWPEQFDRNYQWCNWSTYCIISIYYSTLVFNFNTPDGNFLFLWIRKAYLSSNFELVFFTYVKKIGTEFNVITINNFCSNTLKGKIDIFGSEILATGLLAHFPDFVMMWEHLTINVQEGSEGFSVTLAIAATAGLGVLAFSEVGWVLRILAFSGSFHSISALWCEI